MSEHSKKEASASQEERFYQKQNWLTRLSQDFPASGTVRKISFSFLNHPGYRILFWQLKLTKTVGVSIGHSFQAFVTIP